MGGEGYPFYLWVLYCCIYGIPWQQPPQQAAMPALAPAPVPVQYGMPSAGYPPQAAAYGYGMPGPIGGQLPPAAYHAPPPVSAPAPAPVSVDHAAALPDELRHGFTSLLGERGPNPPTLPFCPACMPFEARSPQATSPAKCPPPPPPLHRLRPLP